jgi:hypothetical protein
MKNDAQWEVAAKGGSVSKKGETPKMSADHVEFYVGSVFTEPNHFVASLAESWWQACSPQSTGNC